MTEPPLPEGLLWLRPLGDDFPSACNSFAVREDHGRWTWIDPGAAGDDNLARTRAELERLGLSLASLERIVVTHPHVDHLGAAAALRREGVEVPVLCHPDAVAVAASLDAMIASFDFALAFDRWREEREWVERYTARAQGVIFAGAAPFIAVEATGALEDGGHLRTGPFEWQCLLTPGHCPGHLSLYCPDRHLLIAGDVVGHSLAWHSPSSGGAAGYLASLDRLEALDVALLLPAHGAASDAPRALIERMRRRLVEREGRLLDTLSAGPRPYGEIYADLMRDPGKMRLFPFVPMLEGHIARLKSAGALAEPEPGVLARA
jgi:glyoxylase-like metal-dependent hydrolase (beta-lactamase superfamily II)